MADRTVEVWALGGPGPDETASVIGQVDVGDHFAVRIVDPVGETWLRRDTEGHWHVAQPVGS